MKIKVLTTFVLVFAMLCSSFHAEAQMTDEAVIMYVKQGMAEGMAKGRAEGRAEGRADAIRRMIAGGLEVEHVCTLMEVTPEDIKRIISEQ
jgi:predicted transposase YdaD